MQQTQKRKEEEKGLGRMGNMFNEMMATFLRKN